VAAGLCFGDAGLAEFTENSIRDAAVLKLASKVRFEVDPANDYPKNYTGHIAAKLKNGETVTEFQGQLRGGKLEAMTREELLKKCQANLDFGQWTGVDAAGLMVFADNLFTSNDVFSAANLRKR
jgi:2-methylcitrate dehydratase PrpD